MMKNKNLPVLGPELAVTQTSVPMGLFQRREEPGYLLEDGTALLESERDARGYYKGGAGMDGMYLQTGRVYAPVRDDTGQIRAFREVQPENYLKTAEMGLEQNYNQIDGIINNSEPPSVRENLRKLQKEAANSPGPDILGKPNRDPERER